MVEQEPERADYLRDLAATYNKMGDVYSELGEEEKARQFYEKALVTRERLVMQEPDRADYQLDLVNSFARIGGVDNLQCAFDILCRLQRTNRLNKTDEPKIAAVEQLLQHAKSTSA